MLWAAIGLLTAGVVVLLLYPLTRAAGAATPGRSDFDISVYRDQLAEVDRDVERGLLTDDEADAVRTEVQRRMLAAAPEVTEVDGEAVTTGRRNRVVAGAVALAVPLGAVVFYLQIGSPHLPGQPFAERTVPDQVAQGETHRGSGEDLEKMVGQLAQRLLRDPDNIDGWLLLGRTYMNMRRFEDAANAFRRALEGAGGRADIAADYGEALVFAGGVSQQAIEIFEEVAKTDGRNPKARYYLGIGSAQQGDLRGALQTWVDLLAISPPNAPWNNLVRQQMDAAARGLGIEVGEVSPSPEARALAKSPVAAASPAPAAEAGEAAAPGPTREDMESAAEMTAEDRAQMIRGMVQRLADRLEENPDDLQDWLRLARAYEVLGEKEKAAKAAARAEALENRQ